MSYQLVDEFRIVGLQNYNLDEKLNSVELISVVAKCKENYQYMVLNTINIALLYCLISSSVAQDTNVIFLICNGLNDARDFLSYIKVLV